MAWAKGLYTEKNPHKYLGDLDNIVYRSSWERSFFEFLDNNPYIINWASEPFPIPYMKPAMVNNKPTVKKANYFPDLFVEYVDKEGNVHQELLEIKPQKQTKPSRSKKATVKIQEDYTFAVNTAKWKAAKDWCKHNGMEFKIVTEKSIYL
jgi:hypothetical protein